MATMTRNFKKYWYWLVGLLVPVAFGAVILNTSSDLSWNAAKEKDSGYLILIDKRTNKVMNDFQEKAAPGVLTGNAVRAGLGNVSDFKEVRVDKDDYEAYVGRQKVLAEEERIEKHQRWLNSRTATTTP